MSSSKDLFEPEDFDNLIAAVDSLEIPLDDETLDTPTVKNAANNDTPVSTTNPQAFTAGENPFGNSDKTSEDEFETLYDLSADNSELNFDEETNGVAPFSSSLDFAEQAKPEPQVAQFAVDDPFSDQVDQNENPQTEEDELIDVYASFLEATADDVQAQSANEIPNNNKMNKPVIDNEFSELESLSISNDPAKEKMDLFGDDGFEHFDGVAAANEISNLWLEEENSPATKSTVNEVSQVDEQNHQPLNSTIAKTQQAANKLKAHLESLSAKQQQPSTSAEPAVEKSVIDAEPSNTELMEGFEDLQELAQNQEMHDNVNTPAKVSEDHDAEFAGLFNEQQEQSLEKSVEPTKPESSKPVLEEKPLPVGDLADEPVVLSSKTDVVSDKLMASFLESTLDSKKKVRAFGLQSLSQKFPRFYLASTVLLSLLGFIYILAIPALLCVALFNGFEMMNSPFTNNMAMLLAGIFGISLSLFMATYKLLDLKFVGPGGITLNNENAAGLIEKIQQLTNEQKTPKVHEIILTRRHELNLIKIPRCGLPVWSKNVLAIGYPLLQTLPPEYFDVALTRRLLQYKKRKNVLHNWLSFMRRTWTIYAVSLKSRKGVIDLLHYCFFAPYASLYRKFAVYVSQKDELLADEKALHQCNDRDLMKTAQTLRITRAMLVQYFWPKLSEELQQNTSAPHYVKPYSQLPGVLKTLLETRQVDAWFIRLGQEETNPGDPEAPFAKRMATLGQRKVALPDSFIVNAAQHYFDEQYDEMTELLDTLWAEEVQKELFNDNIHSGNIDAKLPCYLAIEPA